MDGATCHQQENTMYISCLETINIEEKSNSSIVVYVLLKRI